MLNALVTAKHFSFHYLMPGFSLFASIYLLFYLLQKDKYAFIKPLAVIFIVVFLITWIVDLVPYYKKLADLSGDIRQFTGLISTKYQKCTIIPSTAEDVGVYLNNGYFIHASGRKVGVTISPLNCEKYIKIYLSGGKVELDKSEKYIATL